MEKKKNPARRWCLAFIITLLGLLLALCAANALVDPFGIFGDKLYSWYSYNETNNPRASKIAYLDEHHGEYDSYIVGASSTSSFSKEALDRYYDASFYNLIMYGSDMLDVKETCDYILENYQVENLVVNVFVATGYRYDEPNDSITSSLHEKVSGENPLSFYGKYLLADPRYLIEKIKSFSKDTMLSQPFDVFDAQSGAYDKRGRDAEPIGNLDSYLAAYPVFQNYPQESRRMEHIDEAVSCVQSIKEKCEALGVNLTVVSAPAYYDSLLWYEPEDVNNFYTKLAEVTPFWDFTSSSVSQEPRYFYDETHFRNCVGDMALARMFGDDSVYVPEDFGRLVTPETVEEHMEGFWDVRGETSDYTVDVPILLYHHISEDSVTQEAFEAQIKLLSDGGYHAITFEEMVAYVKQGTSLPKNPVCLTFDDGYLSNYEIAYPILKKYGMKATIFVIGATVGQTEHYKDTDFPVTPHFSFEQAKEMSDSGLISIQSHTYDMHQWEPYETGDKIRTNVIQLENETEAEYSAALAEDYARSKKDIEEATGKEVHVLAYPGGGYTTLSQAIFNDLGVEATLSINPGKATLIKGMPQSLSCMNRFYIYPETTMEELKGWLR